MTVKRIPSTSYTLVQNGIFAVLKFKQLFAQTLLWNIWISQYEQSLLNPVYLGALDTGDTEMPNRSLYNRLYKGYLFKSDYRTYSHQISAFAGKLPTSYNPKYTTWYERSSRKARITLKLLQRSALGLNIPKALLAKYRDGGDKSAQRNYQRATAIKGSRYIPQWVKIELGNRIAERIRCYILGFQFAQRINHLQQMRFGGEQ